MHWTKLEHKVKAGFENFEKYQKSQNKLEASQRTLTVEVVALRYHYSHYM